MLRCSCLIFTSFFSDAIIHEKSINTGSTSITPKTWNHLHINNILLWSLCLFLIIVAMNCSFSFSKYNYRIFKDLKIRSANREHFPGFVFFLTKILRYDLSLFHSSRNNLIKKKNLLVYKTWQSRFINDSNKAEFYNKTKTTVMKKHQLSWHFIVYFGFINLSSKTVAIHNEVHSIRKALKLHCNRTSYFPNVGYMK